MHAAKGSRSAQQHELLNSDSALSPSTVCQAPIQRATIQHFHPSNLIRHPGNDPIDCQTIARPPFFQSALCMHYTKQGAHETTTAFMRSQKTIEPTAFPPNAGTHALQPNFVLFRSSRTPSRRRQVVWSLCAGWTSSPSSATCPPSTATQPTRKQRTGCVN